MTKLPKRLLAGVTLIAAWANVAQAEQFDTTFNGTGRYIVSFNVNVSAVASLELPDGTLLEVATDNSCGSNGACPIFYQLTAAGNFALGYVLASVGISEITAAAVDSHGRIIIVGPSIPTVPGNASDFRVVRYLPMPIADLDPSFSGDGIADVDFFGAGDTPSAVVIDADDNVIVVGEAEISALDSDFAVAKLRGSNGSLDSSFNGSGKRGIAFDLGNGQYIDFAYGVAISANGSRLTVIGAAYDNVIARYRVALARLNRDGSYDTSFCPGTCTFQGSYTAWNNGRRVYYFGANTAHSDFALGGALLGNGDFFIAGTTLNDEGSDSRAAIVRFSANGNYAGEVLSNGLGNQARYNTMQVSDATGQRVLVAGSSGPFGPGATRYFLLQAYSANLTPVAGYGDCLNTTAFCFAGGAGPGDNQTSTRSLTLDHLGRPLFAGSFVALQGEKRKALFARFTNNTGPKPDMIFRSGFQ